MRGRALVASVLLIIASVTVYETLVALEVIELGSLPGEDPPGAGFFDALAALALLAAALVAVTLAGGRAPALSALLAPGAGAFLLAQFHTFDPYYLPGLTRYSERNYPPSAFVFGLAAVALVVGVVTLRRRRLGLLLSVPAIALCGLTAWWSTGGH